MTQAAGPARGRQRARAAEQEPGGAVLAALNQRFPAGVRAVVGGVGLGGASARGLPFISSTLVYTGSNCS